MSELQFRNSCDDLGNFSSLEVSEGKSAVSRLSFLLPWFAFNAKLGWRNSSCNVVAVARGMISEVFGGDLSSGL